MPRSSYSRYSRSSRRPWWLVLLLAAAAWIYNHYFQQPPTPSSRRAKTTRTARTTRERTPRQPSAGMVEGGQALTDVVVHVSDGDTVKLQRYGTVRLIGVDTPEKAQAGGPEAKEFTQRMLMGQTVQVEICAKQAHDRYGRWLGFIYLTDQRGRRVLFNSELIRQGYARVYSLRPCTIDEDLWNSYYEEARAARRGLFGQLGEVPDAAAFRHAH